MFIAKKAPIKFLPNDILAPEMVNENNGYFNKAFIGDPIPLAPKALPELPLFKSPKSKEPFLSRLDIADASVFENY